MDISELKASIHKKIDSVEEPYKLNEINVLLNDILQEDSIDILDELNPEQLERLKLAKQQAKEGKVISHEEVKKLTREWFMK